MTGAEINQIAVEIDEAMRGRRFGKIFPLSDRSFAIDFHPHAGSYLFVDFGSKAGSAFLIVRKLKELERASVHSSSFVIDLRKTLAGAELRAVNSRDGAISLELPTAEGAFKLVIQLNGKPNVFLTDIGNVILDSAHTSDLEGQKAGDAYVSGAIGPDAETQDLDLSNGSLSSRLDASYRQSDAESSFAELVKTARKAIKSEIAKRQRLLANLDNDLRAHGNADEWKMFGDLILANISSLRREGDTILLTDFYDPEMRERAIPADKNLAPSEVAEAYFRKYTKARNAMIAITERKKAITGELVNLHKRLDEIEDAISARDEQRLAEFAPVKRLEPQLSKESKKAAEFTGARKFISSDGFELLVGKKAKDNDHLTFRIAKSHETWMHAADYPGSHVIIRNPNRKEVPVPTLIEAARLAAFYSDAREKPKAAVNYTLKKFVNKPKRAAPGLASLSSYKTLLVESGFPDTVRKV